MILPNPSAPYEQLEIVGDSITIDGLWGKIVIPTDNQLLLPGHNQWTESLNICDRIETPCGGLKNSIVQDSSPGALSIEGDGCYLQNVAGTYTGKSIGAGKLSETASIQDSGTTGITFATADGVEFRTGDGIPFLLRPPYCIVDEFKVINISNVSTTCIISVQCPDIVESMKLYSIDTGWGINTTFTKIGNSYTFSKTITRNSSEKLQLSIKYQSLEHTAEFINDANNVIGLQNMSKSWIALIPKIGTEIDIFNFTERPQQLSYKQEIDGTISHITLYPGNGSINHSRITHPNHSLISGTGVVPDCLNANIEGSVTKFLQSYGMKTDFSLDATVTTWVVPAISDTKILPLSEISDDFLGDVITISASPGEYTCASYVLSSDTDIQTHINIDTDENIEIDPYIVKCWYQNGNTNTVFGAPRNGKFLTPELLLHNQCLISSNDEWDDSSLSNNGGHNYLMLDSGESIDISTGTSGSYSMDIIPISERDFSDSNFLNMLNISKNRKYQFWIKIHILGNAIPGNYTTQLFLMSDNQVLKNITIYLTVLDITLLPPNLTYSIYYHSHLLDEGSISSESKNIDQFIAEQYDLIQHGVYNPTVYYQPDDRLIQVLDIRNQCGIDNSTLFYLGINIGTLVSDIQRIATLCYSRGVTQLYIYAIDEEYLDTELYRNQMAAVHAMGIKIFCAQLPYKADAVSDILDLAVVSDTPDPILAAKYHSYTSYDGTPHKIYSYANPQIIPEYPRTFRLNYGFLLWQNDFDGAMDYAYQHSYGDIWNDFDNEMRDHVFAYPTANGVIDTIQWEGFREAVNDMRYLATLQTAITEANTRGVSTVDIDSWVADLKAADLSTDDLDSIRSQIIDYILQLQSSEM